MKEINLTQGKVALVDDEDFEYLNQWKWYVIRNRKTFYATCNIRVDGKRITQYMHCEVMKGKGIDHRDRNGLNNQKSNLRFCTQQENCMNTRKRENTTSIYKGVSFFKPSGKWVASIKVNGKAIFLGIFFSEIEAALAYNAKAIELFCEFANLNIIDK